MLNSLKKIEPSKMEKKWLINKNEIALYYSELSFLGRYKYPYYLTFFDIENDKKIKSFQVHMDFDLRIITINNNK